MENPIVIVGASVAASGFLEQIRDQGYERPITVIDHDLEAPYDRPPLSKQYLRSGEDDFIATDWDDFNVNIVRAKAIGVNPSESTVTVLDVHSGEASTMTFGSLIIASGAYPARLPFEPHDTKVLRTAQDARGIRSDLYDGMNVVILGAGAIGVELASNLSALGSQVTVLDRATGPLERLLGGFLQEDITHWLNEIGVQTRWDINIKRVGKRGTTWEVEVDHGEILMADMVISAVGSRAAVEWLNESELLTDGQLRVDEFGRVIADSTACDHIFAIGDVASRVGADGNVMRTESWSAAREQGQLLAEYLMGNDLSSADTPYFWTEVAGRNLQVIGALQHDGAIHEVSNNPNRKSSLYRVDNPDGTEAWIGINAQPKIAQLMMRESITK